MGSVGSSAVLVLLHAPDGVRDLIGATNRHRGADTGSAEPITCHRRRAPPRTPPRPWSHRLYGTWPALTSAVGRRACPERLRLRFGSGTGGGRRRSATRLRATIQDATNLRHQLDLHHKVPRGLDGIALLREALRRLPLVLGWVQRRAGLGRAPPRMLGQVQGPARLDRKTRASSLVMLIPGHR